MHFYIKNTLDSYIADALDWGKAIKALGWVSGFEVHWAVLLIYIVNACVLWQPHYLFNSEHVLHIKQQESTDI